MVRFEFEVHTLIMIIINMCSSSNPLKIQVKGGERKTKKQKKSACSLRIMNIVI